MAQSLLANDEYKFSTAEAGWPLRTETFYYSHRKGGPQVLPVDVPTRWASSSSMIPRGSRRKPRPAATRRGPREDRRHRLRQDGHPDQERWESALPRRRSSTSL